MEIHNKNALSRFLNHIYISFIPNKRDNPKQIFIKVLFVISFVTMIVSAVNISRYLIDSRKQQSIINDSRSVWHNTKSDETTDNSGDSKFSKLLAENPDFKGWITVSGTNVDNPIYQSKNNDYYLTHNQKRENSRYGALYFSSSNTITADSTDNNLVIYGHNMKDGTMFGTLKKYKSVAFYKDNPTIELSTMFDSGTYKIYSIYILNASKSDDNDYIYNISRKEFFSDDDFNTWTAEAFQRSLINTGVDVQNGDKIITLVTCCNDFDNARLVIMARKTRDGEQPTVDTSVSAVNPTIRYPKRWYDDRGFEFPY